MPEFQLFDPTDCHFPSPRVPLLPGLSWSHVSWSGIDTTEMHALAGRGVRHFARGRYAMHAAYQAAGVGPNGALLAPAYHCRTMLDPALALGGACALYRLNADLTPQLDSIEALVAQHSPKIAALVVPHYFGFEQPQALMAELAALCNLHGVALVEDCSHAWQVAVKRVAQCPPKAGHVLIGSPYKFFACEDGGTLWGDPQELAALGQHAPGLLAELKALKHTLQRSWQDHRRGGVDSRLRGNDDSNYLPRTELGENIKEYASSPSGMYDSGYAKYSSLAMSRWVMRHTAVSRVVKMRRKNYQQWALAVAKLTGAKALLPELPPDCAPYMFPLLIEKPNQHFYQLKHLGVPIWRWDEMAVSDCPVSTNYRLHLLHLPCHQSLTPVQMQWMTAAVAEVLA